eukprot:13912854-Alexandrium_andersonii.AAC.1
MRLLIPIPLHPAHARRYRLRLGCPKERRSFCPAAARGVRIHALHPHLFTLGGRPGCVICDSGS